MLGKQIWRDMLWDRAFFKYVFLIALPIFVQNIVGHSLNLVDTIMVSALGDSAYAGIAQANRFSFVVMVGIYGVSTGTGIYMAQFWGAKQLSDIKKTSGLGIIASLLLSVPMMLLALFFPEHIAGLLLKPGKSHAYAAQYLRSVAPMFPLFGLSNVFGTLLRCEEKTKYPMYAGLFSMLSNTLLNYLLIEGHFGFPRMEVEGAALATLLSTALQLLVMLYFALKKSESLQKSLRGMFSFGRIFANAYAKTVSPVIFNEFFWSLGIAVYSIFFGMRGDIAVAAMGVYTNIEGFSFVLMFALVNTTAIIIGKELGAGHRERAYLYAKKLIFGCLMITVFVGSLIFALRFPLVGIFAGLSQQARDTAIAILLVSIGFYCIRTLNAVLIVGVFRAGGDTMVCLLYDAVCVWLIALPLLALATLKTAWPIEILVLISLLEEFFKAFFAYGRFKSKKWMRNLTAA